MAKKYLITLSDETEKNLNKILEHRQKDINELGIQLKVTATGFIRGLVKAGIDDYMNFVLRQHENTEEDR